MLCYFEFWGVFSGGFSGDLVASGKKKKDKAKRTLSLSRSGCFGWKCVSSVTAGSVLVVRRGHRAKRDSEHPSAHPSSFSTSDLQEYTEDEFSEFSVFCFQAFCHRPLKSVEELQVQEAVVLVC